MTLACSLCLVGCSTTEKPSAVGAVDAESIYSRASVHFADAVLFKPAEPATRDLLFNLAPLVVLQVSNTNLPPVLADGPCSPASSLYPVTNQPPVVQAWADTVQLRGHPHARISYTWNHPSPARAHAVSNNQQGVRITLGNNGQPMIWEILADTSGRRLIVVSDTLERAAAAAFGPPLPGRKFSAEKPTNAAPDTVVMRVIDDGPVAMGPILYLAQGTRDVATIICRCMPAQAGSLAGTRTYDLLPLRSPQISWPGPALDAQLRLPNF